MTSEWDEDVSSGRSFGVKSTFGTSGNNSYNSYKPRQSDWICTTSSCQAQNFGNRTECYKCHEPKGNALDATDSSGGFKPRQRTEWICTDSSCGANNFGNRTECFKCQQPKGDALDVPSDSSGGFKPRANDWLCTDSSCGVKNFGNRTECFKCHEPKGDAVDAPSDSSGGFKPRANDWLCTDSSCGVKNFGSRSECFKCHEPKGDAVDAPSDSSGGFKPRASDWLCTDSTCGVKNFGNRTECFKCHEPKGDAVDAPADSSNDFKPRQRTEWMCTDSDCGTKNFGNRTECFKCQQPKGDAIDVPSDSSGGFKRQSDWMCTNSSCGVKNFGSRSECFKCHEPKGDAQDAPDSNGDGGNAGNGEAPEKPKESYIPEEADESEIFNMGTSTGINFRKYDEIPIKVTGENIPPPCTDFTGAGLTEYLQQNIAKCGYKQPTPVQKCAIPIISAGRDLMACAQTGSGKSAAFLLPIINKLLTDNLDMTPGSPHVLIVAPTRELNTQIYYEAKKYCDGSFLKCCRIYGGTVSSHQAKQLGEGCHILVATPGRLMDFVDRTYIDFRAIRFIVLDEADRMLDMGFLPAVEKILNHPSMVAKGTRQTLMFSATFPQELQAAAGDFLHDYLFLNVGVVGGACQDIEQNLFEVARNEKRDKLMELLDVEDPKGTIVFVDTKRTADFLATFLSESKHPTTSIHGDRLQSQREAAIREFKSNKMKVLIATSVAARGLDIPNVCHVINYDMPNSIDEYVHRIGRTGRIGNKGKASSFYDNEKDAELANDIVNVLKGANQTIPDFLSNSGGTQTAGSQIVIGSVEEW